MSSELKSITHEAFRTNTLTGLAMSFIFAGLTGIGAFIIIPLPFTPIPITGQTFFSLLSGYALGKRYGSLSQVFYLLLGVLGIPWFASGTSGLKIIIGATGGYLIGFVISAYVVGYMVDRSAESRKFYSLVIISLIGTVTIYFCGIIGLMIVAKLGIVMSLTVGVFPFLPGDLFKAIIVAILALSFVPQDISKLDLTDDIEYERRVWRITGVFVSILLLILFIFYLYVNVFNNTDSTIPPKYLIPFSLMTSSVIFILLLNSFKKQE